MAGLCKFVFADLSGASVPAELQAVLIQAKKPYSRSATLTRYSLTSLIRRRCELLKATTRTF
jgi:hypothetical protein